MRFVNVRLGNKDSQVIKWYTNNVYIQSKCKHCLCIIFTVLLFSTHASTSFLFIHEFVKDYLPHYVSFDGLNICRPFTIFLCCKAYARRRRLELHHRPGFLLTRPTRVHTRVRPQHLRTNTLLARLLQGTQCTRSSYPRYSDSKWSEGYKTKEGSICDNLLPPHRWGIRFRRANFKSAVRLCNLSNWRYVIVYVKTANNRKRSLCLLCVVSDHLESLYFD